MMERKLAQTEFESLLEAVPDAIVVVNAKGVIEIVNAQSESLFGYHRQELLGRNVDMLVPEGLRGVHANHRKTYGATSRMKIMGLGRGILYGRRKDGTNVPVEITLGPLESERGPLVAASIRDISDRLQAENQARVASQFWREVTGDALMTLDSSGQVITWNAGAERMLGWTSEEARSRYRVAIPPDMVEEVHLLQNRVMTSGEPVSYETERLTADGRRIPVMGTLAPLPAGDGPAAMLAILKDMSAHKLLEEQSRALARMEERERIAMDLHDSVIQSLYGVTLRLAAKQRELGSAEAPTCRYWRPHHDVHANPGRNHRPDRQHDLRHSAMHSGHPCGRAAQGWN